MLNKLKPFVITICIFFQLGTIFSCKVSDSQSPALTERQQQLIRELNGWLFPLSVLPLEMTNNELSFLDQLSFAKIVALGEDTRITLWAHNGHIAKDNRYQGDGSMGYHLHENLGDLYQAVGFGFSKGSFTAVGQESAAGNWTHQITYEPVSASVNFLFHHASLSNYAFNLDAIPPGSAWNSWLSVSRPFLSIGAGYNGSPGNYYRSTNLRQHYNWIIYFDTTNASMLIPR
jgi:erythromycin esterase-like protein